MSPEGPPLPLALPRSEDDLRVGPAPAVVADPVAEELLDADRLLAPAAGSREPGLERVGRDDRAALLPKAARHVSAPGRDVQHLHALAGLAPLDDQLEVAPRCVPFARAVRLGAAVPEVRHAAAASSTARRAASSIVGSTCTF